MHGNLDKTDKADWKFFGMSHNFFKLFVFITFVGVIIIVFNLMYSSYYYTHPYVPADTVTREANVNMEGELQITFAIYLLENAVALALLLPYSFRRNYWSRVALIQILFGSWMIILLYLVFNGSNLYRLNIFGVLLINVLIFILLISSIIAEAKNRKRFENL